MPLGRPVDPVIGGACYLNRFVGTSIENVTRRKIPNGGQTHRNQLFREIRNGKKYSWTSVRQDISNPFDRVSRIDGEICRARFEYRQHGDSKVLDVSGGDCHNILSLDTFVDQPPR
jgi:hypothetical protein